MTLDPKALEKAAEKILYSSPYSTAAETARAAITAYLDETAHDPAPVSGWRMAPVEPTPEMTRAAMWALDHQREKDGLIQHPRAYTAARKHEIRWQAMLAASPEPPVIDGWRDIASAPKDGTEIDVWATRGHQSAQRYTDVHFHMGDWLFWSGNLDEEPQWTRVHPTHWRPLPAPPKWREPE